MSEHRKLWGWLCGDVMRVHGSTVCCYGPKKTVQDGRDRKRPETLKKVTQSKVAFTDHDLTVAHLSHHTVKVEPVNHHWEEH